ncbi:hypothetical protein [Acidiplasma sp.]|uniref:hypothetical protein n=1 Tax=Acidiplasma sp. TaxID=1872114 RepID=UPI0025870508|nr:hypothetical protein [Acidiplasma sp.]
MKEAIRVQNPDGSFKIVFREKSDNKKEPEKNEINKVDQESKEKQNKPKKKQIADPRYYNPLNPEHIDIFGRDLLNKDLIFSLLNGETIKGKMIGFGQYEILLESGNKKLILLKQGIMKIEVL